VVDKSNQTTEKIISLQSSTKKITDSSRSCTVTKLDFQFDQRTDFDQRTLI